MVQSAIRKAIADTSRNTGMLLTVAFDYGTRVELIDAVNHLRATGTEITPEHDLGVALPARAAAGRRAGPHQR